VIAEAATGYSFPRRTFHEHFVAYLTSHYDAAHAGRNP
jgi:hypothetical protein